MDLPASRLLQTTLNDIAHFIWMHPHRFRHQRQTNGLIGSLSVKKQIAPHFLLFRIGWPSSKWYLDLLVVDILKP